MSGSNSSAQDVPALQREIQDAQEELARVEGDRTALLQRISQLEGHRRRLSSVLSAVLGQISERGHPGEPCLRTGWISERTVTGWRMELTEILNADFRKDGADA